MRKPKFEFSEIALEKGVIGYRIDRDMTAGHYCVTLFWDDFFGFSGVGDTIEIATGDAVAKRAEFFRPSQMAAVPARERVGAA